MNYGDQIMDEQKIQTLTDIYLEQLLNHPTDSKKKYVYFRLRGRLDSERREAFDRLLKILSMTGIPYKRKTPTGFSLRIQDE